MKPPVTQCWDGPMSSRQTSQNGLTYRYVCDFSRFGGTPRIISLWGERGLKRAEIARCLSLRLYEHLIGLVGTADGLKPLCLGDDINLRDPKRKI
ncbi:hypothetical protein PROSTU_00804 [Providencia stuartii ATCC 25827]|uniref:Uncharacterized protein n=1 Tax=Providencia stuartii ATCC 25827 TaxID=471874 RepID=A0AA86YNJ7_PROST|nr:hypothetical protein PROSTU_00804 [Providencia stuartii ATCC 25827]